MPIFKASSAITAGQVMSSRAETLREKGAFYAFIEQLSTVSIICLHLADLNLRKSPRIETA